jgi:hypothetical protein
MTAKDKLTEILADLRTRQVKAANRGKPALWAYYHSMRRGLEDWFQATDEGAVAGAALALIQIAEHHQDEPPAIAAYWACMAVYARRIFREWTPGRKLNRRFGTLGNLDWLRRRADEDKAKV